MEVSGTQNNHIWGGQKMENHVLRSPVKETANLGVGTAIRRLTENVFKILK